MNVILSGIAFSVGLLVGATLIPNMEMPVQPEPVVEYIMTAEEKVDSYLNSLVDQYNKNLLFERSV